MWLSFNLNAESWWSDSGGELLFGHAIDGGGEAPKGMGEILTGGNGKVVAFEEVVLTLNLDAFRLVD